MKSVCIMGAGPGGLVAAKTFLQTGQFEVTVYEKKDRIGGIWALDRDSRDGFLSPYTPTNLSRFTVGFSDLDWNSVDFSDHQANGTPSGDSKTGKVPTFPKAWMANRYLETYRKRYIPDGVIHCSSEIINANRTGQRWEIQVKHKDSSQETRTYDYLIMASGFFALPRSIAQNVTNLAGGGVKLPVKTMHSSQFRDLDDLFPNEMDVSGKKILMLGGGNSSGETAAAVALQLSNTQWSPSATSSKRFKDCKIIHVTPRPFYALPPFNEYDAESRSYVPLDFRLYDLSKRTPDLPSYGGRQANVVRDLVHSTLQSLAGSDQADISEKLVSRKGENRQTAYVALTESYPEYVRSGLIEVISGRVTGLEDQNGTYASATIKQGDEDIIKLDDIAAVIYATGYTPIPALDMLDDCTKTAIGYDSSSMRLPMMLDQWQTMSKDALEISFIGFYEGPYWPMMEMQAQLTAHRWLSHKTAEVKPYETKETLDRLRQSMRDRDPDIPQFWFNDYVGYLDDIAKELNLERNDGDFEPRKGCTSPARFLSPQTDKAEANAIMNDLHEMWHTCVVEGRFVPRAAFRALQGDWTIDRRIESALSTFPSGTLTGTATFHPRIPTPDKSGQTFDLEYLYIESGTFTLSTGHTMTASRRYVYRYSEANDTLSIWFVKPENNLEVDYLFHNLEFAKPEVARKARALVAKADHLCVEDMYWTEYRLPMKGIALREFEVKHTVKGPEKNYVATTKYERPKK